MGRIEPVVLGELSCHPLAPRFAAEVVRVHCRYAEEVVARFRLCPFLRDAETGFGRFCVLFDREPRLPAALAAAQEAAVSVIHLVFPCIGTPASPFERFAARFGDELRRTFRAGDGEALPGLPVPAPKAPVLAAFHPEMAGDDTNAHRLVGLLRHAPDPFVQLIPPGLSQGGTVLAGGDVEPGADPADDTFARLQGAGIAAVRALLAEIQADRDASYAPYLEAFGLAPAGPRFSRGASSGST
jgi:hypothetical protein